MAQILLVDDREPEVALYTLNLNIFVGSDVIHKKKTEDAVEVLRVVPEIDLILTRAEIDGSSCADPIYQYLLEEGRQTPFIVMGEEPALQDLAVFIPLETDLPTFIKTVARVLGVTAREMSKKIVPQYFPVKLSQLKYVSLLTADLYTLETLDNGEPAYIKKISAGDSFDEKLLERYKSFGHDFLYVHHLERLNLAKSFNQRFAEMLSNQKLTLEERVEATSLVFDHLAEMFQEDSIDKETYNLSKETIQSAMTVAKGKEGIDTLLESLLKRQHSFLFKRSILTNYLCLEAIKNEKSLGKKAQQYLAEAAFFNDLLLESDSQAKIISERELNESDLNDEERVLVSTHAMHMSKKLDRIPEVSNEVKAIVREHHGKNVGIGFERKHFDGLYALTYIFMACEAYAHKIVLKGSFDNSDHETLKEEISKLLPHHNIEKTLKALDKNG